MPALERPVAKPRPVYLNLVAIRQPIPAIVSILHRISGALLFFVGIPTMLWALQSSLSSPERFEALRAWVTTPFAKLVLLVLAWGYLHHLLAGLRHVLLDVKGSLDLGPARQTAAAVLVISLLLTLVVAIRLW